MPIGYNIYCDESCHLEHDQQKVMVLGAIRCSSLKARELAIKIKELKAIHGMSKKFEIKWTKASPAKLDFYKSLIDFFLNEPDLVYRAVVADKLRLCHEKYNQNHDDWYYKMYFLLLGGGILINPQSCYRIYIDIKDTISGQKLKRLHDILSNDKYDFDKNIIHDIQAVDSHEIEQVQLCDFFTGLICAANRGTSTSSAKKELVRYLQEKSGLSLKKSTLPSAPKLNIFLWETQQTI